MDLKNQINFRTYLKKVHKLCDGEINIIMFIINSPTGWASQNELSKELGDSKSSYTRWIQHMVELQIVDRKMIDRKSVSIKLNDDFYKTHINQFIN